jgi:hypothetical protein
MDIDQLDLSDTISLSFVIRIWLEESGKDDQDALWRGQIRHVLSGDHLYFQDVADMVAFIEGYKRKYRSV